MSKWIGERCAFTLFIMLLCFSCAADNTTTAPLVLAQPFQTSKGDTLIKPLFVYKNNKWWELGELLKADSADDTVTKQLPSFNPDDAEARESLVVDVDHFAQALIGQKNSLSLWFAGNAKTPQLTATQATQFFETCEPHWALQTEGDLGDDVDHLISNHAISVRVATDNVMQELPATVRDQLHKRLVDEERWQLLHWVHAETVTGEHATWFDWHDSNAEQNPLPPAGYLPMFAAPLQHMQLQTMALPQGQQLIHFVGIKTYRNGAITRCDDGNDASPECVQSEQCRRMPAVFEGALLADANGQVLSSALGSHFERCMEGNEPHAAEMPELSLDVDGVTYVVMRWFGLESTGATIYRLQNNALLRVISGGSGC